MRKINEVQKKEIKMLINKIMTSAVSSDYASYILEHTKKRKTFVDDVIEDVMCASAWEEEGYYNEDDIRLSIGRVLMERLKIEI